jgi:hypothetical protein
MQITLGKLQSKGAIHKTTPMGLSKLNDFASSTISFAMLFFKPLTIIFESHEIPNVSNVILYCIVCLIVVIMSSPFNKHWSQHNDSIIKLLEDELPQSTLYWLLISICAAIAWIVYLTYYNSRVIGLILTAIINRFVKFGYVRVGKFRVVSL